MKCLNCKKEFTDNGNIGTKNRNHCPYCLYSQHLDESVPGDRKSKCYGLMKPIGIVFKNGKVDRYGKKRIGEVMIVHNCTKCGHTSYNRVASDDNSDAILQLADDKNKDEVRRQLFGDVL